MKRLFFVWIFILTANFANATDSSNFYGRFEGELILKPLPRTGNMQLVNKYSFIDPAGGRWEAPAGTISDGASIPSYLWPVMGDPWGADYRNAAVIHDVACKKRDRPWEAVHLAFYYAMLTAGVSERKASIMYQAVYRFGPRWGVRRVVLQSHPTMKGIPEIIPYYEPAKTMTSSDYREIEENVKLLAEMEELDHETQIAALQIPGRLDRQKALQLDPANFATARVQRVEKDLEVLRHEVEKLKSQEKKE